MNALLITVFATVATLASASIIGTHVGAHGGAVVAGPAGVVTSHGAVGPAGHIAASVVPGAVSVGLAGAHGGAVIAAPAASAVVAGPGIAHGLGLGLGAGLGGWGGGLGGWGAGVGAWGVGHGGAVVTNGGGVVGVSGHGASVTGPHTAPVVVSGPSGTVAADGLWGPTTHWASGGHGWGHGYGHGHW